MRPCRVVVFSVVLSILCPDTFSQDADADPKKLAREATRKFDTKKFRDALDLVDKALLIKPEDYRLWEIRCWCLLELAKRDPKFLDEAATSFRVVRDLRDLEDHSPRVLLGIGVCHRELARRAHADAPRKTVTKNLKHAREAFQQLTQSRSFQLDAHAHLLEVCRDLGDVETALMHGGLALQACDTQRDFWKKQEALTRRPARKKPITKQVQDVDRRSYAIRITMAKTLRDRGRHREAAKHLDAAIKTCPKESSAWYHRGKVREFLKQPAAAAADFAEFLRRAERADVEDVLDCVVSLRRCSAHAKPAVEPLLRLAADEKADDGLRCEAIITLGILGPSAIAAAAGLRKLSIHEHRGIAAVARAALRQIDSK